MKIVPILALITLTSCSTIEKRDRERNIQTKIVRTLNKQSKNFSKCSKDSGIFKKFKSDRVKVTLNMQINSAGEVDSLFLDNKEYPDQFSECIFQVANNIKFPALNNDEVVQFSQPLIFND